MKVLDPLAGIKAACGDPVLHMGFLIATAMMPFNQHCNGKYYGNIIPVLVASHAINSFRNIITNRMPNWILRYSKR
jgi:hypothetical protein